MTGAYVRIFRDGRWINVEINRLSDDELEDLEWKSSNEGLDRHAATGWKWAKFLASWMRDNIPKDEDVFDD